MTLQPGETTVSRWLQGPQQWINPSAVEVDMLIHPIIYPRLKIPSQWWFISRISETSTVSPWRFFFIFFLGGGLIFGQVVCRPPKKPNRFGHRKAWIRRVCIFIQLLPNTICPQRSGDLDKKLTQNSVFRLRRSRWAAVGVPMNCQATLWYFSAWSGAGFRHEQIRSNSCNLNYTIIQV